MQTQVERDSFPRPQTNMTPQTKHPRTRVLDCMNQFDDVRSLTEGCLPNTPNWERSIGLPRKHVAVNVRNIPICICVRDSVQTGEGNNRRRLCQHDRGRAGPVAMALLLFPSYMIEMTEHFQTNKLPHL